MHDRRHDAPLLPSPSGRRWRAAPDEGAVYQLASNFTWSGKGVPSSAFGTFSRREKGTARRNAENRRHSHRQIAPLLPSPSGRRWRAVSDEGAVYQLASNFRRGGKGVPSSAFGTFSRREKETAVRNAERDHRQYHRHVVLLLPSPSGRRWRAAPDEGTVYRSSSNFRRGEKCVPSSALGPFSRREKGTAMRNA